MNQQITIEHARYIAQQYPTEMQMRILAPDAYRVLWQLPGLLDQCFSPPPRVRPKDEASIRARAKHYEMIRDFREYECAMYDEAVRLGILYDLGLTPPPTPTKDKQNVAWYAAMLLLNDGELALLFGVTCQHPISRYAFLDHLRLDHKVFYRFQNGSDACEVEKHLKKKFKPLAARRGQSPIKDKPGTSGEIVLGVSVADALAEVSAFYQGTLPRLEHW